MFLEEHDLVLVLAEHVLHTTRQVVHIAQGAVADHEDILGTVITGNYNECSSGIVNVIDGLVDLRIAHLCL